MLTEVPSHIDGLAALIDHHFWSRQPRTAQQLELPEAALEALVDTLDEVREAFESSGRAAKRLSAGPNLAAQWMFSEQPAGSSGLLTGVQVQLHLQDGVVRWYAHWMVSGRLGHALPGAPFLRRMPVNGELVGRPLLDRSGRPKGGDFERPALTVLSWLLERFTE